MPRFLLKRIENLINSEERDKAIVLWLKACEDADVAPLRLKKHLLHYIIHIIVTGMTLYTFFKVLTF